jgi:hypothetical protein
MGAAANEGNEFVDLGSMDHAQIVPHHTRGNVIRRKLLANIPATQAHSTPEQQAKGQAPEVLVHRNGEAIESIEFVCSCGQHAFVQLEYDDE